MKRSFLFIPALLAIVFLVSSFLVLKGNERGPSPEEVHPSGAGIKLDDKWLREPSSKDSIARVELSDVGVISVQEASETEKVSGQKLAFQIAIQDPNILILFNTHVPEYTNKSVQEADLKTILKHCKAGDMILLILSEPGKGNPKIQRIRVESKRGEGKC